MFYLSSFSSFFISDNIQLLFYYNITSKESQDSLGYYYFYFIADVSNSSCWISSSSWLMILLNLFYMEVSKEFSKIELLYVNMEFVARKWFREYLLLFLFITLSCLWWFVYLIFSVLDLSIVYKILLRDILVGYFKLEVRERF